MDSSIARLIPVFLALLAAVPALAQHGRHGMLRGEDDRDSGRPMQRYYQRQDVGRDTWQGARMSVEERRQLRRDIHEAGREIYRPQGRRQFRPGEAVPAESR